ncbi:MAG: dockerin type I repeat-containing protein [Pirellulales bacterium]|nr:dockerin type I repeat-containing protein [Pirellulales bacterium]
MITADSGQLATDKNIYTATMESLGGLLYQSELPGFGVQSAASGVPSGKSISFNVVDNLFYWSAGALSEAPLPLTIENEAADAVDIDHDTLFQSGLMIGAYNGATGWHQHLYYTLPSNAPVGVYAVVLQLTAPGLDTSSPFVLAFNRGETAGNFSAAVAAIGQTQFGTPGDANLDGQVDGADYTIWADHFQSVGSLSEGDFNRDGQVDGADYTIWADHFMPASAGVLPIPEPSTWLLSLAALICVTLFRVR